MDAGLAIAVLLALGFAVTNGLHDASNAIATLVATRAATPLQAILLATVFNLLGPLLVGAAVADTIGGIVTVSPSVAVEVIGSGLAAATAWNLTTWRLGLPSSSGHALVGGLVGAAVVEGGTQAVNWGGLDGIHPVGVFGTLIALAVSPILGGLAALVVIRALRRAARRATRRWRGQVQGGQWVTSAALSFSHGANDAQKSVGVVAALLLADGSIDSLSAPTWVIVACSAALTAGTALGGWRIIRTVGRRIYRIHPLEGLSSQSSSAVRHPWCLIPWRPRFDEPGGRLLGGRHRRRPPPPAPRQLGDSSSHRTRLAHHPSGHGSAGGRRARRLATAHMSSAGRDRRWFLPETPDVIGLLRAQTAVTLEGLDALAAWAGGDAAAAQAVRDAEPRGDTAKREVLNAVREAFILQLEPEDVFTLSRGIDWILDRARDLVEEAEAMSVAPDSGIAEMVTFMGQATRQIDDAIGLLGRDDDRATAAADSAIKTARTLQHVYYRDTAKLLEVEEMRQRIGLRELYRRCDRISEVVIDVAERIVYAVVKES